MGSGAPREGNQKVIKHDLDPKISQKLEAALTALDGLDPKFKQGRDDERNQQPPRPG